MPALGLKKGQEASAHAISKRTGLVLTLLILALIFYSDIFEKRGYTGSFEYGWKKMEKCGLDAMNTTDFSIPTYTLSGLVKAVFATLFLMSATSSALTGT